MTNTRREAGIDLAQPAEMAAGLVAATATSEPDEDTLLVKRARSGNRAAFALLIERNYDRIHRTAARWSGSVGEAEDIAQDVCVKLALAIDSFDGRAAFSTWLYRIVLNAVRDRQRKAGRQARRDAAYLETRGEVVAPDQEDTVFSSQLWGAVRALPPRQRDAVLLVYAEELSHAEAAEILGIGEATVSWHVHEARKSLKERMQ